VQDLPLEMHISHCGRLGTRTATHVPKAKHAGKPEGVVENMNWDQVEGRGEAAHRFCSQGNSEVVSPTPVQARVGELWCKLLHDEPMWPAHGHYECRTCGRLFQVCWELPSALAARGEGWPREVQADMSLAAGR
jgi:hypothetical protein